MFPGMELQLWVRWFVITVHTVHFGEEIKPLNYTICDFDRQRKDNRLKTHKEVMK